MLALKDDKGFTFIEIMIAVFLLVTALLGLISTTGMVINSNSFSKMMSTATTLAQDKMEELRNTSYTGISEAGSPETVESIYTRRWTVASNVPATGMKTIAVTVSWSWKGSTHSVTMNGIVAQ